eukprot:3631704-Pleurochrysis_carterae.AAC.1
MTITTSIIAHVHRNASARFCFVEASIRVQKVRVPFFAQVVASFARNAYGVLLGATAVGDAVGRVRCRTTPARTAALA